jgi:hypothetical protein
LVLTPFVYSEEVVTSVPSDDAGGVFGSFQTYDVFFSLHPDEIDRLSNVRLLGTNVLGGKTFLRFQVLLNNQLEQGFLDADKVTAILPTTYRLTSVPEVMLDRQPIGKEKVKEVRSETVREVLREVPASPTR